MKVKLVIPKIVDVPKQVLEELGVDRGRGRLDTCMDEHMAEEMKQWSKLRR